MAWLNGTAAKASIMLAAIMLRRIGECLCMAISLWERGLS
jgi:hypothetical protein